MKKLVPIMATLLAVSACGYGGDSRPAGSLTAKPSSYIKVGKPYKIRGITYRPAYQPNYNKTGVASWYGPGFHGKSTANGERYNKWAMTAAHPTLPLPSLVRVTRLETGQSIVVRVNDRGPFANGRIIDLSHAAAEKIGMLRQGVAKVRVTYLKEETDRLLRLVRGGKRPFEIDIENDVLRKTRASRSAPSQKIVRNSISHKQPETNRSIWQRLSIASEANAAEIKAPTVIRSNDLPPLGNSAAPTVKPAPKVEISVPANDANSVYDVLPKSDVNAPPVLPSSNAGNSVPAKKLAEIVVPKEAYVVKLGTFSDVKNAKALGAKLQQTGLDIQNVQIEGRQFYRVSTNYLSSKAEADRVVADAFQLGLKDAYIVRIKPQQ